MRLFKHVRVGATPTGSPALPPLQPMQPGASFAGHLQVPATKVSERAPIVHRVPRIKEKVLYSYGAQVRTPFHMRATGQVECSMANVYDQGTLYNSIWNLGLFEAGYPQNLGTTVKVASKLNDDSVQTGSFMRPQPQQRISVFTRRAFSGAQIKPAKPAKS